MKAHVTLQSIKEIHHKFHVPLHVVLHMKKVAELCVMLAEALRVNGHSVDAGMVKKAALLHDVLRVCDFRNLDLSHFRQKVTTADLKKWQTIRRIYGKQGHVKAMTSYLKKMGAIELANLVEKHDFYAIDRLGTLEEKVLYYCDKRAEGDKVVSLRERFEHGKKRNAKKGENDKLRLGIEKKVFTLEKEFRKLLGGELPF